MARVTVFIAAFALIVCTVAIEAALAAQTGSAAGGVNDARLAESFVANLQRAVAGRDRRAVVAMVQYPITIVVSGVRVPVQDAAAMIRLYDSVFTPALEAAIAKSGFARTGRAAPTYPVESTTDGLSIASGLVWAQRIGSGFMITRLTTLPSSSAPSPARPAAAPRSSEPIRFRAGQPSAKFSGLLMRRDEVQSYAVSARKGQVLQAEISGFKGRDVILRVIDAQSGRAVDPPVRDGARTWRDTVPANTDYRIDVVRAAPGGGSGVLYLLVVTLR